MKEKMREYEIKIKGFRPLVWNRPNKELAEEYSKLKKKDIEAWDKKNWIRKLDIDDGGNVLFPAEWIYGMLVRSAMETKIVPERHTSKSETLTKYVKKLFIPNDPPIVICKKEELEELKEFVKSNPNDYHSGRVWRYYPMLSNWEVILHIIDPLENLTLYELESLLKYGSKFLGVGDLRNFPKKYGRFNVEYVKEVKQ